MTTDPEPEIILYDLASTKGVCFSPAVWRIRLMLNYKKIPYKTVFVEFPDVASTLKPLGVKPHDKNSEGYHVDYTVPTINHLPSNTYMMDSISIAIFLEKSYPNPPLPMKSELGREVLEEVRVEFQKLHAQSLRPRELDVISPRSQEYFRRKVEPGLGHPLEDLLANPSEEEATWKAAHDNLMKIDKLIATNGADGPFILGAQPSFADFALAGSLQFARVISEDVYKRIAAYPAFKRLRDACSPWMERDSY